MCDSGAYLISPQFSARKIARQAQVARDAACAASSHAPVATVSARAGATCARPGHLQAGGDTILKPCTRACLIRSHGNTGHADAKLIGHCARNPMGGCRRLALKTVAPAAGPLRPPMACAKRGWSRSVSASRCRAYGSRQRARRVAIAWSAYPRAPAKRYWLATTA